MYGKEGVKKEKTKPSTYSVLQFVPKLFSKVDTLCRLLEF